MKEALKHICRELRQIADAMPPGPQRDQMQVDLTCLKVRLMALPARVAAQTEHKPAAEVAVILQREVDGAFSDIRKWVEPR